LLDSVVIVGEISIVVVWLTYIPPSVWGASSALHWKQSSQLHFVYFTM